MLILLQTNLMVVIATGADMRSFLSWHLVSQPVWRIMEGKEFPLLRAAEMYTLNRRRWHCLEKWETFGRANNGNWTKK